MLRKRINRLTGRGKTGYLILAGVFILGLAVLFLLDIWLLGTLAAIVQGVGMWFKASALPFSNDKLAAHAFDGVSWYWQHPFLTAWAWIVRPEGELSNPAVRTIWLALNGLIFMAVILTLALKKINAVFSPAPPGSPDRDIRKLSFKSVSYNITKEIERTPAGQVFLGLDDKKRPVRVKWSDMTEHVHILGGSGTGKTSLAVIPVCLQAIRHGLPVVAVDFKGDKQAIQLLSREAQKVGRRFYLFSLHPQVKSNTYNPLSSGSTLSKVERVMTALELVFDGEAKFYTYCQQAVFIPLLKYLDREGVKYTLKEIQQLFKSPGLVEMFTGDNISPGQLKGLTAALTSFADLNIINAQEPDIDLGRMMQAGDVVYFDLRSAIAPELFSALGKMIAMDLQALASYRSQADKITLLAIDEFQNMACQAFRNIISKVRSANYALLLANQALGDLRAVGDDFLNTVATNTRTKIIFNVDDPEDAEYFAKMSGQVVIRVESQSRTSSLPGDMISGVRQRTEGESYHDQYKNLVHSNVLLKLPFGKSVIYRCGDLAVLANHSHLISKAEKDQLERMPYPDPVTVPKRGVKTVGQLISRMKQQLMDEQNKGHDQSPVQPGQVQNAGVEVSDFNM